MSQGTAPLLQVKGLKKYFPVSNGILGSRKRYVRAVDGVDFDITSGETFSLVGESGSGKSTIGRLVMRLIEPTAGTITFDGRNVESLSQRELRSLRSRFQMVFQDPFGSLNPRMRVGDIIAEPLRNAHPDLNEGALRERLADLLDRVGMPKDSADRYPHEFSGGQRQRISIARALAPGADLIVCDEAVSALDVSVKAQVINLMRRLQDELGVAYLFISHDLGIVDHISDRVAVLYLGQLVEVGPRAEISRRPAHPYTKALISAVPKLHPQRKTRQILVGEVPNPISPPSGCRFNTRCPLAKDICRQSVPTLRQYDGTHQVACHLV